MFSISISRSEDHDLTRSNLNKIVSFNDKYVKEKRWERIQSSLGNELLFLNELLNVTSIWDTLALKIVKMFQVSKRNSLLAQRE